LFPGAGTPSKYYFDGTKAEAQGVATAALTRFWTPAFAGEQPAFHFAHEGTKEHEGHEDERGAFVASLSSFVIFV
jgi:hypothetical protein